MVKKSLIPYKMGKLSYVYFYPFLGTGDYQQKRAPTRVFFVLSDSLKLKAPSSIYLLGLAKNPWGRTIRVSLNTTPQKIVWQHSPFGNLCSEYSVMCLPWIPSISKASTSSKYFPFAVTFPLLQLWSHSHESSFICCLVRPAIILWTKEVWLYHTPPTPLQLFPSPSPPHSVGQSADCLTPFGYLPHASGQGNIIALTRGRSPSIDDNTYIPEDRPEVPVSWFH